MSGDVGNQRQNGAPDFRFLTQVCRTHPTIYPGPPAYTKTTAGAWSTTWPMWAGSALVALVGGGGSGILGDISGSVVSVMPPRGGGGGGVLLMHLGPSTGNGPGMTLSGTIGAGGVAAGYSSQLGGSTTLADATIPGLIAGRANGGGEISPTANGIYGGGVSIWPGYAWNAGFPGENGGIGAVTFNLVDGNAQPNGVIDALGGMPGMVPYRAISGSYPTPSDISGKGGDGFDGSADNGNPGMVCVWWCY